MTDMANHPEIPVVHGETIALPPEVEESFGLTAEIAERVSAQVLQALGERMIDPATVVFSGYDDYEGSGHDRKAVGDEDAHEMRGAMDQELPPGKYEYFFDDFESLADGERGPLAYAASGDEPVLGVYDLARLREIGYDDRGTGIAVATPDEIRGTMVMEFRPTYERPVDE